MKNIIKFVVYVLISIVVMSFTKNFDGKLLQIMGVSLIICYIFSDMIKSRIGGLNKVINAVTYFLKLIAIGIGLGFAYYGRNDGTFNIKIGFVFLVVGLISATNISTSITGLSLLNVAAFYVLGHDYFFFTLGIVSFLIVEFISGTPMQLLAPFTKDYYQFSFRSLSVSNKFIVGAISASLVVLTVLGTYATQPFQDGYAKERLNFERQQVQERNKQYDRKKDFKPVEEIQNNKKTSVK